MANSRSAAISNANDPKQSERRNGPDDRRMAVEDRRDIERLVEEIVPRRTPERADRRA